MKKYLQERYFDFLAKNGENDIDTRVAKQLYQNYCTAETITIQKAAEWLEEVLYDGHTNSGMDKNTLLKEFRKAMEKQY